MAALSHPHRPSLQEAYETRQRETPSAHAPRSIADPERTRRPPPPRRQTLPSTLIEALRSGTPAARVTRFVAHALAVVLMVLLALIVGGWVANRYAV